MLMKKQDVWVVKDSYITTQCDNTGYIMIIKTAKWAYHVLDQLTVGQTKGLNGGGFPQPSVAK